MSQSTTRWSAAPKKKKPGVTKTRRPKPFDNQELERQQKKQRQDRAKEDIARFLQARHQEVEEAKKQNQSLQKQLEGEHGHRTPVE